MAVQFQWNICITKSNNKTLQISLQYSLQSLELATIELTQISLRWHHPSQTLYFKSRRDDDVTAALTSTVVRGGCDTDCTLRSKTDQVGLSGPPESSKARSWRSWDDALRSSSSSSSEPRTRAGATRCRHASLSVRSRSSASRSVGCPPPCSHCRRSRTTNLLSVLSWLCNQVSAHRDDLGVLPLNGSLGHWTNLWVYAWGNNNNTDINILCSVIIQRRRITR